jgi:hypothetical protein
MNATCSSETPVHFHRAELRCVPEYSYMRNVGDRTNNEYGEFGEIRIGTGNCHSVATFTANLTWPDLGSNAGRRGGKL